MKMKQTGFTLIELMIVVAIFGILAAIIAPAVTGVQIPNNMVQNGFICENGLSWSVSQGYRTQVIGANGLPQTCQ